jgi:hypothetical protein
MSQATAGTLMAEDIPIRCDECRFVIGSVTTTVHGSRQMCMSGNDANCKHPPISKCPSANTARSQAYAAVRPVGREIFDDVQ